MPVASAAASPPLEAPGVCVGVPRVDRLAPQLALAVPADRVAGQVRVPEWDRASGAKPFDVRSVEGRIGTFEHLEARAGRRADQVNACLHGERDAVQGRELGTRGEQAVRFLRGELRLFPKQNRDRIDRRVHRFDPCKMRSHNLRAGYLSGRDRDGQRRCGHPPEPEKSEGLMTTPRVASKRATPSPRPCPRPRPRPPTASDW